MGGGIMEQAEIIKQAAYQACLDFVAQRIETARTALNQARESSNDDTKSSAGDKYETSREMMQQEIDRNKRLLMDAEEQQRILSSLTPGPAAAEAVRHGSLVETSNGLFYISISAGQLNAAGHSIFAVSPVSPIGAALMQKKPGDHLAFNGRSYEIKSCS
ncbi:3-oxoacyl-ACP synthase [Pedobacter faecalis]|uniref:3-oxoacyl-ACP synthase n=1 Tax=Pedobacter faecalis TaxID=3041495 RepID=UPI00254A675A|nr:3-oxoacyl-ACP synthase [Pedobacter sp. ELA7]